MITFHMSKEIGKRLFKDTSPATEKMVQAFIDEVFIRYTLAQKVELGPVRFKFTEDQEDGA